MVHCLAPIFVNKILLEYNHFLFVYVLSMAAFVLHCRVELLVRRLYGSQGLKYLLCGHSQERFDDP